MTGDFDLIRMDRQNYICYISRTLHILASRREHFNLHWYQTNCMPGNVCIEFQVNTPYVTAQFPSRLTLQTVNHNNKLSSFTNCEFCLFAYSDIFEQMSNAVADGLQDTRRKNRWLWWLELWDKKIVSFKKFNIRKYIHSGIMYLVQPHLKCSISPFLFGFALAAWLLQTQEITLPLMNRSGYIWT